MIENGEDRLGSGAIVVKIPANFMFYLTWRQDPCSNGMRKLLFPVGKAY